VKAAHNPNEFLQSPTIKSTVVQIISKAELIDIASFVQLTVITFLAANVIFFNAQHPGVIQFMTVQELIERTETENEQILVTAKEHKFTHH